MSEEAPPGTPVLTGYWAKEYARLQVEINQLRAEVERLRQNDELAHVTSAVQNNAILKLSAEVAWLRAALFKIEAGYGDRLSAAELASIARRAL